MAEAQHGAFDASAHLVKLKGRDYLEVRWRLVWLRTEHPDASIETDLVRLEPGYAVFRAKVSIPDGGSATGYGSETKEDFGDYLEKAETKALGRALGALGYGTQFTEDFDMVAVDGGQRVVDTPVQRPQVSTPAPQQAAKPVGGGERGATQAQDGAMASEAQVKAIFAIGKRQWQWTNEDIEANCRKAYGKLPADLTKREASELIERLKKSAPAAAGGGQ